MKKSDKLPPHQLSSHWRNCVALFHYNNICSTYRRGIRVASTAGWRAPKVKWKWRQPSQCHVSNFFFSFLSLFSSSSISAETESDRVSAQMMGLPTTPNLSFQPLAHHLIIIIILLYLKQRKTKPNSRHEKRPTLTYKRECHDQIFISPNSQSAI